MNRWDRVDGKPFRLAIYLTISLTVGLLLGFGVFDSGSHDLSQIARLSAVMAKNPTFYNIVEIAGSVNVSPGRHLPFVALFWLTDPATPAAVQHQAELLTWLIGFGFVPATAYLAGEALEPGYGRWVLAVDVLLRVTPLSRYRGASPHYVLGAGFAFLCLMCAFSDDLRWSTRGISIGAFAAVATWVTPVAALMATLGATIVLLLDRDIRSLAAAAVTGFVVCLPLLAVDGGTSRTFFKFLIASEVYALIHPETSVYIAFLHNYRILMAGIIGTAAALISDRDEIATIGALTMMITLVLSSLYLGRMAVVIFTPLLTVDVAQKLKVSGRQFGRENTRLGA